MGLWRAWLQCPRKAVCLRGATVGGGGARAAWPQWASHSPGQSGEWGRQTRGFRLCCLCSVVSSRQEACRSGGQAEQLQLSVGGEWPPEVVAACESLPRRPRDLGVAAPSALGDQGWASDIQGEPFVSARRTRGHAQRPSLTSQGRGRSNLGVHELKEKGLSTHTRQEKTQFLPQKSIRTLGLVCR